jgi:hypothetical protein
MANYAPITLQIVDENGRKLIPDLSLPFSIGINVKQTMECAFVLSQTAAAPDPFLYTVEYYGYSEIALFPGYLGYEIESIGTKSIGLKPTNNQFYWKLAVNGMASLTGADTTFPGPGSTVLWTYTRIPADSADLPPRTNVVQSRRASRSVSSRLEA